MQAIILAAGMGKRLKELTRNNTKCMVKVNGQTLIERLLLQLDSRHLSRIVIVVGYEGQKLKDFIKSLGSIHTPIIFIDNPVYATTNNIYSLSLAKDWLCKEDTLLFESDLIFEPSVLDALLDDPRDSLALVDKYESWMDGTCVKINTDDEIIEFIPKRKFNFNEANNYYKTVNVYKFSKDFSNSRYVPFLDAYQGALGKNEYYEQVLNVITMLENPGIKAKRLKGELWYEIDDIQDLNIAESLFAPSDDERVNLLERRYGGYWRYPHLLDFCYLVNPYFPPKKMKEEIKANFDTLLTQYPSGMEVNSLLAARNFGLKPEHIVVGNGAAELIKSFMSLCKGRTGVIRPTFEEYGHRYNKENTVVFVPNNDDFSYTAKDVIDFFSNRDSCLERIDNLILINPDNPSGNYIPKEELLKIVKWTGESGITLLVDESFADFADEPNNSLLDTAILENNKHLCVMKSISKSYGVPGLRLGILASGNIALISFIKKDVSIWNINSFAEFYMQIYEKYSKDYDTALEKFKLERKRFISCLEKIPSLRVVPSQANYVMCELLGDVSASMLTKKLLVKHDILLKNLVSKIDRDGRQFVRLAVRDEKDNNKLIQALEQELH